MKQRLKTTTALTSPAAALLLLALLLPVLVLAQQTQTPARRGELGRGASPNTTKPASRTNTNARRSKPDATAVGIEGDVAEALTVIQENYVDGGKLDYNNAFKSSIIGMLRTLDPHSNYYDAKEYEEQRTDWRSEYYGIGATIGDRKMGERADTYVLATFEDTPAARARLRFGDRIVEIDGQSVQGKTSSDVRDHLRGAQGTIVKVTVERAANGHRETLEITRDAVSQPTVPDYYFLRPGVGYIDLTHGFNYTTAEEFTNALEDLRVHEATSYVVDLRGNGGGIVDQAVRVAESFLSNGQTILTQKGRNTRTQEREYRSENNAPDNSPLAILVNGGTASASEIVAGALQDHDRALIIGETTFGKGLVQSIMPLDYGAALTLTTSKYYTPSGRLIQRDYSKTSYYDYIYKGGFGATQSSETATPQGPASHTDTGRAIYGGGGITPDEPVKPRTLSLAQVRLIDPIFFFARELVNNRIAGFEDYKIQRAADFAHNLSTSDYIVNDRLFNAFKEFAAAKGDAFKLTDAQLEHQREFIKRQLRYDIATAAYGTVKATQALIANDPQVLRSIEILPRARELAAAASRGRNPPQKSFE